MLSMANGSILSFKRLSHYLLTLLPTAMAALSKLASLFHICRLGCQCISDGRTKMQRRWLCLAEAGQSRGMKRWLASSQCSQRAGQSNSHSKAKHRNVFSPAKAQSPYRLLEIFFFAAVVGCWPTICFQNHLCKADFNSVSCTLKSLQWFGHFRSAKTCNAWNMLPPCPI